MSFSKTSKMTSLKGDEIVISGISGLFPKSENVNQFMENLYNKVDMVMEIKPEILHPEVPRHQGKITDINKFDAQFFRVTYNQVLCLDPKCRKLLEHAYSAIYDSGINPMMLHGKKLGVFIGSSYSDNATKVMYNMSKVVNNFTVSGTSRAMFANRISYWIDGRGPSYNLDCACSSSMATLHVAYNSIFNGECEAALVGGCNLCLSSNLSLNLKRSGMACIDGKTKCFDKYGDGCVRAETIGILFLQKAKDAKRIYAEVYHTKLDYGLGYDRFLPIRYSEKIVEFLRSFYAEIDISPEDVEYIEANGAAIAEADENELKAIGEIFTTKQKSVKIGCVKSNMGNSEGASGISSLTKVCLAYHTGKLPANLHYNHPQDNVDAVRHGRIEVLKENSSFNRGFVALNSFSYTGANVHVLLKGHYKEKNHELYKTNIPYLLNVSGRQEGCVEKMLNILSTMPVDAEQIGLLHNIHQMDIPGHTCRGYIILGSKNQQPKVLSKSFEYYPGTKHPVCFLYSGMGSQWAGMGTDLMRLPIFFKAIKRCHKALVPKGIDLFNILTSTDKTIIEDILNSFVGITAIQIGLTDVLKAMDISSDYIIGHSAGEIACAYADGCFTLEEAILSSYSRGIVAKQTEFIHGAMAAVGLGYNSIKKICPPEIEVACHNSSVSSTISGPYDNMKEFIDLLKSKGVLAKEVSCGNIAFHSRYVATAGPVLLQALREEIKNPKPRSTKWLSTSIPQSKWEEDIAKFSSPEYHTNNLLAPVYFEETSKLIPEDAIVIEIAPHGLLQAIIKQSLNTCIHIPLTRREHSDPLKFLLEAIGRLYQNGLNPKIDVLYPKIDYPVSTETPMLSHLVGWEHSENWNIGYLLDQDVPIRVHSQTSEYIISLYDGEYKFVNGYLRNGFNVIPEALFLVLTWKTLAMTRNINYKLMSVKFHDVYFNNEIKICVKKYLKLKISINRGNNKFEIVHEDKQIAYGYIAELSQTKQAIKIEEKYKKDILLNTEEISRLMALKGISLRSESQAIMSANLSLNRATINWTGEWVAYLDALIQFNAIKRTHSGVSIPKLIQELTIDIKQHDAENLNNKRENCLHTAHIFDLLEITRCGGVTIKNIVFSDEPIIQPATGELLTKQFWPNIIENEINLKTALHIFMQIIAENVCKNKISITEMLISNSSISEIVNETIRSLPMISINFNSLQVDCGDTEKHVPVNYKERMEKTDAFIMLDFDEQCKNLVYDVISPKQFVLILAKEKEAENIQKYFCIISSVPVGHGRILILMKKCGQDIYDVENMNIIKPQINFSNVQQIFGDNSKILNKDKRTVIVYDYKYNNQTEIKKLLTYLRSQKKNESVVVIEDENAPTFTANNLLYKQQLCKNLMVNILKQGQWGGYYYTPIVTSVNEQNFKLTMQIPNNLTTLKWTQISCSSWNDLKIVRVHYAGLSQKDCEISELEKRNQSQGFGMDFSGTDYKGDNVMGLVAEGAVSSVVEADSDLLWPVPKHWSLKEAATVPLPYVYAYYCLVFKSSLTNANRVFINGGAGALGQAIISICLALDCNVYTTVSTVQKKRALLRLFPKLNENNIFDSCPESFFTKVIAVSQNKRCDIVINCASGKFRELAMKCVGFCGTFLDVSKYDMELNKSFRMCYLNEDKTYKTVTLSSIFDPRNIKEKKAISLMIADGIAKGIVRPLTGVSYAMEEVSRAFKLLSLRKYIGRILIEMRCDKEKPVLNVTPRITCSTDATFVVVCTEQIVSLQLVEHLISRGARNFVAVVNSVVTGYFHFKLECWKKLGVKVNLFYTNIITKEGSIDILKQATDIGPLEGIFVVFNKISEDCENDIHDEALVYEEAPPTPVVVLGEAVLGLVVTGIVHAIEGGREVLLRTRYFVIINQSSPNVYDENLYSESEKVCEDRFNIRLPALAFKAEIEDNKIMKVQIISGVLSALEMSINLNYYNVYAPKRYNVISNDTEPTDSQESDINTKSSNTNNSDLRLEIKQLKKLPSSNQDTIHVANETSTSLLTRQSEKVDTKSQFVEGFQNFYGYIENDIEKFSLDPVIMMSTKVYKYFEETNEIDATVSHLILIPGFEGHHRIFKTLCEPIKFRAATIELDTDLGSYSIEEMAFNIFKLLKKRFELKKRFHLLGYSFGVNIALELAALLESEGQEGIVFCLDSSPDALRLQMKTYIGDLSSSHVQNTVISQIFYLMTGQKCIELMQELETTDIWYRKIEIFIRRVKGLVAHSHEYIRLLLETTYERLILSREYYPNLKLNSQLVLIRSASQMHNLPDDYNLAEYSRRPVKIYEIDADHANIPNDGSVPYIINNLFEPELLEEFNNINTCETYLKTFSI